MTRLNMPVGVSGFEKLRERNYFYIDKTELIEQILLDDGIEVRLITRPRRFGKTLSMSMLESFFDIRKDSKCFFHDLKIMNNTELCDKWMNRYPVIFLSFKEVDGLGFEEAYAILRDVFAKLCTEHNYLLSRDKVTDYDKDILQRITYRRAETNEIKDSLKVLTHALRSYWGKPAIILLDEYDVPIAKASEHGYYEEMLNVIKGMMQVFKDNNDMALAVVTGCLRVAKESIFTGTNNFAVNTISSNSLDEYFGFTQEEADRILENAGAIAQREKVKEWYDGYRFGNTEIYCPWDVINHVDRIKDDQGARPEAYWINTSGNELVKRFVDKAGKTTRNEIERLIAGEVIEKQIRLDLTYDEIDSSIDNLWSVLFTTGYLTYTGIGEDGTYRLLIPNKEVREVFRLQIQEWFKRSIFSNTEQLQSFWKAFEEGNTEIMEKYLNKVLSNSVSVFDTKARNEEKESSYHNLLLGILTGNAGWLVKSNVEAGEGFADIIVETDDPDAGVVVELKYVKEFREMEQACRKALEQIRGRRYQEYLQNDDRQDILLYGITFCKKRCRVVAEKMKAPGI